MSRPKASTQTNVGTTQPVASTSTTPIRDSVKDTGRVHIGGMAIRFDSIKDAGRVHVGGMAIKF